MKTNNKSRERWREFKLKILLRRKQQNPWNEYTNFPAKQNSYVQTYSCMFVEKMAKNKRNKQKIIAFYEEILSAVKTLHRLNCNDNETWKRWEQKKKHSINQKYVYFVGIRLKILYKINFASGLHRFCAFSSSLR